MLKPQHLSRGDRVAIVAPSVGAKKDVVSKSDKTLKRLGLEPVVFPPCYLKDETQQPSAEERAKDVMAAFADSSIRGIFALKAVYGCLSVLPLPEGVTAVMDTAQKRLAFTENAVR